MIGILSDSHDNRGNLRAAVHLFNQLACELVIHAGDFVAPFAARELELLNCPVKAVFGNCDGERKGLEKTINAFGQITEAPFCFSQGGREILLTHTHFSLDAYQRTQKYDVIIFGHTHRPEVRQSGKTLILNPGETGGWVTGKSTIATLDLENLAAEILSL